MADNVAITAGSGTNIAADDVSSVFYQKVKLDVLEVKGDWLRVGWNQWTLSKYNGVRYLG